MTIIAGVISLGSTDKILESTCESLRRNISRTSEDQRIEFQTPNCFFIKIDISAFDQPAHRRSQEGSFAMLAGEPLLVCNGPRDEDRGSHLTFMHDAWDRGDFSQLRHSCGTYCAAYFDPRSGTARLIADRLGLRTLYYAVTDRFVYFSSALRVLETLNEVPKVMNVTALAEATGFGYPFGAGTPYAGIKMLLPCETITVGKNGIQSSRYFHWDAIEPVQSSVEEAVQEVHRLFQRAVRRRLRGDRTTFAYLSGGLDSRCTVAALLAEGVRVYTFNFSPPGTQDQVFAFQYANESGTIHQEIPAGANPNWSSIMANAWRVSQQREERKVEHPNIVWTGEGGSVGLGHVYITPEIVEALQSGNPSSAIKYFLQQQKKALLSKILVPEAAFRLQGHLENRLNLELKEIRYSDPVRAFYIFLNLNGPRRHLVNHFETIDQHRLEFQVPFYDSEFLEYLTALPVDPCLYHRLYVDWLMLFDSAVRDVPWQAYPGHVPSLVPVPNDLPDQWSVSASSSYHASSNRELIELTGKMLSSESFPSQILSRLHLRLMLWATRFGLRDYSYALRAGLTYYRYANTCCGIFKPIPLHTTRISSHTG